MSPLLALGAGFVVAFLATRTARRSARSTELRLLSAHLARQPGTIPARRPREEMPHVGGLGDIAAYEAEARESLDEELRKVRGERAPSPYTPEQARAARRAMQPAYWMRVKP